MKKFIRFASLALADDQKPAPSTTTEFDLLERLLAPVGIARGMTPQDVFAKLGRPGAQLAANIWAYWDFKAKNAPRADQCETLLVIFAENRVQRVRLTDSKPVRTFLAQQETKAAKKRRRREITRLCLPRAGPQISGPASAFPAFTCRRTFPQ